MRLFAILLILAAFVLPGQTFAQEGGTPPPDDAARAATGGAQTRDDIMRRQRGEEVETRERDSASDAAAAIRAQLGTRGSTSDSELWEKLRYGKANVTASNGSPASTVLIQDSGMAWFNFREGPLRTYGGYLLLGMFGLLAVFYLFRGKIRIEHGRSDQTILRFNLLERAGHWLLAVSFIVLGITGLITLFGRVWLIPWLGKESFAPIAALSKWVHNWIAWAFIAALAIVFLMWVLRNIPNRHDLVWLAKGGGLFSKGVHPPAKKFNAGQKIVFWSVIVLGASISASGLSLLMPFEFPMFAKTFDALNYLGFYHFNGGEKFPTVLTPHAEMQLASLWHAIVSFILMAIIIAHIYLGSVGMEGAFDAMGKGQVDLNWAREHHNLWVEEEEAKSAQRAAATPAE